MRIPKNYLNKLKKRSGELRITSERQEIIQRFVEAINKERVGTEFKPVIWKQINGLLAHLKGFDLAWFYRECEKAENFGRFFFGMLKRRKKNAPGAFPQKQKRKKNPRTGA